METGACLVRATGSGGDRVFVLNETGVTTNYTLTGFNASSAGPITIEPGVQGDCGQ